MGVTASSSGGSQTTTGQTRTTTAGTVVARDVAASLVAPAAMKPCKELSHFQKWEESLPRWADSPEGTRVRVEASRLAVAGRWSGEYLPV